MSTLLPAVIAASLLGSLHCVAMCGPLVTLVGGASLRLAAVHAAGRLVTYAVLGALAGLVGHAVDLAGELGSVQRAATLIAGAVIVAWGARTIAIARGWWVPRQANGAALTRGLTQLRARRRGPATRAWFAGVLTGLVPCGWLWAFVVSAAGTGSAVSGALVMIAFWAGTVPAMTGLLAVAGPVLSRLRARMPVVTSIALIVLGVGTLATRWNDAGTSGVEQPSCHEGSPR